MGNGGSRLNAEREAIPAKVLPMLRRRIEEIRRRKRSNGGKDATTPSGTELLLSHDGKARDDEDEIENSTASCQNDAKGKEEDEREENAKEKNKEGGKEEKAAKGNVEEGSQIDAKEEDESHDKKEDDAGDESSILYPGSPSFRIFFTENLDEDDDEDDDNDNVNDGG